MKKDIFKERDNIKPLEYPHLIKFKEAINHSYWLHTEFNLTGDIQDYKVNISPKERNVIKNSMLAISQIEVAPKKYWGKISEIFPKPEIDDIGGTFSESEIRHKDAYAFLLEKLGLNAEFKKIHNTPAIIDRVNYLNAFKINTNHFKRDAVLGLVLFSLFVEHISLFGQFLIIMSYNKHRNLFKGMSNIVEATSKEEEIHGRFGIELYKIIRRENKELFDDNFYNSLQNLALKALKAEYKILDWIYESGDIDFIPKEVVINYIGDRFNKSLKILGLKSIVKVDKKLLKQSEWFDVEILSIKDNDFFNKRGTDYSKNKINISIDAMFRK